MRVLAEYLAVARWTRRRPRRSEALAQLGTPELRRTSCERNQRSPDLAHRQAPVPRRSPFEIWQDLLREGAP